MSGRVRSLATAAAVVAVAVVAVAGAHGAGRVDGGGLDPDLDSALSAARAAAADDGVILRLTSGRRSVAEQQKLFDEAVAEHGSVAAARRWVLPPAESTHVTRDAVDIGPRSGAAWLERYGAGFGLCRTFENEWWHFEYLSLRSGQPCPRRLPDASPRHREWGTR